MHDFAREHEPTRPNPIGGPEREATGGIYPQLVLAQCADVPCNGPVQVP